MSSKSDDRFSRRGMMASVLVAAGLRVANTQQSCICGRRPWVRRLR